MKLALIYNYQKKLLVIMFYATETKEGLGSES